MEDQDCPCVKILVLGDPSCGKSSFLSRLKLGRDGLQTGPISLLRDLDQPFVYDIRMYNHPYRFEFYDTASPKNWTLLEPGVVILCFDVTDRVSLDSLGTRWRKEVYRYFQRGEERMPVMLLGLKRDLRGDGTKEGIVDPQEGYRVAAEIRCDRYAECSAMTGELMHEVFEDIARMAAKTTKEVGGQSGPSACLMM